MGQQPGPTPGPASGLVATTAFADDGPGAEIWESNCDLSHYSTIAYRNNAVQSTAGGVYFRNCTGATPTVAAFNQLAGKASGNVDAAGDFMSFAAIPSVILPGEASVLAWCAPNASGLGITGGVGPVGGPCGTQDVTPANTTTYVLSATSTAATSPATVTIGCAAAGTPLPVSPANGDSQRPPGTVMLGWYPAAGATSYDVYLDTSAQPRTLVAADVVGTSAAVAGLGPGVQYRWRVVAKSTSCTETSAGPASAFTTCANPTCEFVATFDDDDLSGWTRVGKGVASVFGGSLHLATRRHLTVVPPAPATGDGSLSLALALESGRREVRLLLGYRDPRTYSELAIRGAAGRVTLSTRAGRHRRRLAVVKRAFPTASVFTVQLVIAGANLTLLVEGTPAMTAALARPSFGTFAIQAVASTVAIDDVRIRAN